jgi:nucleoside transporter
MSTATPGSMKFGLSVMMFLQIFIWGAWFELNFGYVGKGLGMSADQQWYIFSAFNIGAVYALFFGTQFADRRFAAEKFLAFSHLIGGLAIGGLFFIEKGWSTEISGTKIDLTFWAFFILMLIHALFYVPTISITNSIAFTHLRDPHNEFGRIRVWGTIGWIMASWPLIFILVNWAKMPAFGSVPFGDWVGSLFKSENALAGDEYRHASRYIYLIAGGASLVLAVISLKLPHTPPKPAAEAGSRFAWFESLALLRKPFVLILFIVTFIDAAVHQSFFVLTEQFLTSKDVGIPSNWASPVMKIGQIAEIITMIFLGYVLKNLGWRWTMILGVLGHAARFAVFAYYPDRTAVILINVVHGICYAFFFATVYIFIDEYFPKDARASAQGLFNLLILGLGPFAANFACTRLSDQYALARNKDGTPLTLDYTQVFLIPLGAALVAAMLLIALFHPPKSGTNGAKT